MTTPFAVPPLVIMGVSGSGKTTVGTALARRLGVPYADADDFHSQDNVAKMSAGIALDDADRLPWLRAVGAWLAEHDGSGCVVGCSALRRHYRDVLRDAAPTTRFLHLDGPPEIVKERVSARSDHFMPASLVDSQFETLEPLDPDEPGVVLDLAAPVERTVETAVTALTRQGPDPT